MILSDIKLIFVHQPRTAGGAIEHALIGGYPDPTDRHFSAAAYRATVPSLWDKYHTFSVVRDPFDWLVSLWLNHGRGEGMLFREWLRSPRIEPTMTPFQSINTDGCDFILRFETVEKDFNQMMSYLGFNGGEFNLPVIDPSEGRRETYEYYDDLDEAWVRECWSQDFETLCYENKLRIPVRGKH